MDDGKRYIIPSHLFRSIAEAAGNPQHVKDAAKASLDYRNQVIVPQKQGSVTSAHSVTSQPDPFIPQHILDHLKSAAPAIAHSTAIPKPQQTLLQAPATHQAVYDIANDDNAGDLPGELKRQDENQSGDRAVNEVFDNVGKVLDFWEKLFGWQSFDGRNADVQSSVHFGQNFQNAYWDLNLSQMVFGDGGEFIHNFTASIDVIGHEMTHAVTDHVCPLEYQGQSGALNEHISDVFGVMVKQMVNGKAANESDWLIGEDCLFPGVKGVALRSMKDPGTAYDDPRIGKDLQPAHMSDYKDIEFDNGGVHIYSGIPNKAFYLVATALGGNAWEKAGQIWWRTMRSGQIPPRCEFQQFATQTIKMAKDSGDDVVQIVQKAWLEVGVDVSTS